jgi:hypothetical protein
LIIFVVPQAKERKKAANRAAKEEKKKKSRKGTNDTSGEKLIARRSDLAAMAPPFANRGQQPRNENKPTIQLGGLRGLEAIGAAAAAAARLKSEMSRSAANAMVLPQNPVDLMKESVVPLETRPGAAAPGIDAAAALAAMENAKKQKESSDSVFGPSNPEGKDPSNVDKACPDTSRSSDAPEYAAGANQFPSPAFAKAALQHEERSTIENICNEHDEPVGQDPVELAEKQERTRKSAFAAKAAAYRRRKGTKDERDTPFDYDEGSKLGSSQFSSRDKVNADWNTNDYQMECVVDEFNFMPNESKSKTGSTRGLTVDISSSPSKEDVIFEAPSRQPSRNECSLAIFLERDQGNQSGPMLKTKVEPPSLGSFFERQVSHEIRTELLRQNFDDSSVAILADRLEKKAVDDPANWNEGGGISDFIGWANQAIQASDTESVRGFEISRNLDDQHDFDDDSTIATYYDDDASIVSSNTMTPMHRDGQFVSFGQFGDFGQGHTGYSQHQGVELPYGTQYDTRYEAQFDDQYGSQYDDNVESVTAKVAASILFNDSEADSSVEHGHAGSVRPNAVLGRDSELIDMALTFNDVGLDAGLSFGADVGFDDGLGFGGVEGGLSGFGVSASQGHGVPSSSLSYGDQYGVDSFGDDGGTSDKRKSGSNWFQWGKGK